MEKFVPYEKLSKRKKREIASKLRGSWGNLNPVTRKSENPKAYHRKKAWKWSDESPTTVPFDYFVFRYSRISVALVSGLTFGMALSMTPFSSII